MFAPGQRIISEEFGDITADVIESLMEMAEPWEPVIIEREQAQIAAAAGQTARDLSCGRLIAQIHPDSYNYWLHREGPGFWQDKGNMDKFLRDNPACRVNSRSPKIMVGYGGDRSGSRGGRWRCAVPCRS